MSLENEIEMYGKFFIALQRIERCKEFAPLVPEVRSNLVYARPDAISKDDVLAVDGRITIVNEMPLAAGRPRFGASSHMARLIIELGKVAPSFRSGINFANNSDLSKWLEDYCLEKGWIFSCIDRRKEPKEIRAKEGASMPWKVREAINSAGGRAPKIFYETGAVGKEPVSVLAGPDPIEVADEICEIARSYDAAR